MNTRSRIKQVYFFMPALFRLPGNCSARDLPRARTVAGEIPLKQAPLWFPSRQACSNSVELRLTRIDVTYSINRKFVRPQF
jgi:hypothetical protein